ILALSAFLARGSSFELIAASQTPEMVRSTDRRVTELLAYGYERSKTFRLLVECIQRSDTIVYVEFGVCAFGHLDACVLPFVANTSKGRYLRIVLTARLDRTDREHVLALIGHELQHAVEIVEHPEVVDVQGMLDMYRRIGFPLKGRSGYETSAARAAERAVLNELKAPIGLDDGTFSCCAR
ncbi:MAG TPA: hypothetical protein VFI56_14880, partial [Vicinamibacterales bacterium]|nr:hypothetical protein [Vicinamibacterales bacterium]